MAKIGSLAEILEIKFYLNFPCQGSTTSFQMLFYQIYNNDYSLFIDIYFYETFSTLTQTYNACAQFFRCPV